MPNAAPNLGYGQRAEVSIDKVNQWMRGQPWYQQTIASFGQSLNNVHLNDSQKQAVIRAAQANGVVVDEGNNGQEIDDSGNFRAKGHKLRNTLIVAGIAAATIATMGAAGAFSGAAAAGAGGAGAGGGAAAAGTAGSLAGIEGGVWGLSDAALASLGTTGAMAAVPVAAGTTAAAGLTGAELASAAGDAGAWGADGSFLGDTTISASSGATGGSSVYSRLLSKYGAGAVSQGVDEYLQQKRSEDQLAERRRETDQRTALDESELDPFRGVMAQGRDMARLDLMGRDYTPTPLQLDSKYGAGVTIPQGPSYAPSALTRQVLQGAQRNVAAGNTVPTMTNPQNYGNIPVVRTDPAAMASASPIARPLGPALSRRRRWPGQTDDENSPWLRPSV